MNYFALGVQTFLYSNPSQRRFYWGLEYIKSTLVDCSVTWFGFQLHTCTLSPSFHSPWHLEAPLRNTGTIQAQYIPLRTGPPSALPLQHIQLLINLPFFLSLINTHTHTQGYFPLSQSSLYRPFIVPFSAPLPPGFPPRPPGWNEYPCFVHPLSPLTLNEAPSSYSATVTSQSLILPPQSPVHPSWEDITPPLPFDLSLKTVNDFPPRAG